MKEAEIMRQVRLAATKKGWVLLRNNTGRLQTKDGKWVQYGLCVGSADLIGWCKKTGKFIAIEVKAPGGRLTDEQVNFLNQVTLAGGIAGMVRGPEELDRF